MEIEKKREQEAAVVSLKGRMDAVSSPEFEKEMAALIAEGNNALILDFAALDYISSSGLRSILTITKKLKEKDGKLLIAGLKGMVKEVFEISGFRSIIPIFESVESARSQI
ncbi:MAG: STAS domain-containing protein [Thermodesulfobacteriota bacterium]|jgi:anti-anti-sigma factor|nr:MAG: STAS domain-containing protein [Thermodesulfobacteriota bacterium]